MDIFTMCYKRQGTCVRGSGEATLGNLFESSFIWKIEMSPTNCINLKYYDSQEIQPKPTNTGDVSQQEIYKFDMYNIASV